ncbi:ribosome silencing factor [Brucepastera parasyntrophica]|uniref:ribosome silencing factor n=1 Tax=Brucepastera parasyntrophica TaxID=2880008 RepID=UPI00210AD49E|nr:ribosome silencing factor [Brucepastera parasyntrophica]ULQ60487.1 ribosome silencing factor [Brucepastera parasyntrophica]
MEKKTEIRDAAIALGNLLTEHKAQNVVVLDISSNNTFADYFIIATTSSSTHSQGLQRHIHEAIKPLGLEVFPTRRKIPDGEDWVLIDLGSIIIHLMTETARRFYDLEKLWFGSPDLLHEETEPASDPE